MDILMSPSGKLAGSLLMGVAVGWLAWVVTWVLCASRRPLEGTGTFERARRDQLRAGSLVFRLTEPLVEELASVWRRFRGGAIGSLQGDLIAAREPLPWRGEEFLAAKTIEGVLAAVGLTLLFGMLGMPWLGACFAGMIAVFYPILARRSIGDRARRRLKRLRIRLPFAIDLISLMMEAGASFPESLETVVRENEGHPLGQEFGEVVRQIALGRPRAEALRALQQRLGDPDVAELVFAINKGEELGTPITSVLRDQSNQMRVKRSQWGEKAAGEAQVQLVFPGMVVMVACLLVVVGPIILPALLQYLG